jgi:ABC-type sugar transport system ATPase subunit
VSLLVADNITKHYGNAAALSDVSVTLDRGEIVALAGENGSGKSTFAKVLAGLTPLTSGQIHMGGRPLASGRPKASAEHGISIVPQEVTGIPSLSVADNIILPTSNALLSVRRRRRDVERAHALLGNLGADIDPAVPFRTLEPADAAIVELARALIAQPKLLVVDETTAYLEKETADRMLGLLRSLRDEGLTVLFISHRLGEVCALADRTVVLRDGHLVGELAAADMDPDSIASMMVGRSIQRHQRAAVQASDRAGLEVDDVVLRTGAPPVSLRVAPGEVVGLAGLVNSGCVAMLERIAGERTGEGTVRVADRLVRPGSVRGALASGIAMLPGDRQKLGLLRESSVRANIMLGSRPLMSRTRLSEERAVSRDYVNSFGIRPPDIERPIKNLSGGNQQKALLARALRRDPGVLLLNEPTRGVDIGARADVYRVLYDALARGISILFYSTDMQEIMELADRVLVLYDNELITELSGSEITEDNISRGMGGHR